MSRESWNRRNPDSRDDDVLKQEQTDRLAFNIQHLSGAHRLSPRDSCQISICVQLEAGNLLTQNVY